MHLFLIVTTCLLKLCLVLVKIIIMVQQLFIVFENCLFYKLLDYKCNKKFMFIYYFVLNF